jgi:hypothetical protein
MRRPAISISSCRSVKSASNGTRPCDEFSLIATPGHLPTLILGGHFVGGTIVRDGDAFRLAI